MNYQNTLTEKESLEIGKKIKALDKELKTFGSKFEENSFSSPHEAYHVAAILEGLKKLKDGYNALCRTRIEASSHLNQLSIN